MTTPAFGQIASQGTPEISPETWPSVRQPWIEHFETCVYGKMPDQRRIEAIPVASRTFASRGFRRTELDVRVFGLTENASLTMQMLVDVPIEASAEQPVACFLGLNFQGNHTTDEDPELRITPSWVRDRKDGTTNGNAATANGRGVAASRWPTEAIVRRGYALATIYYGDIDPDFDDGFQNGLHGLFADWLAGVDADQRGGSIAAWAYGLSCGLDAIESRPELGIDPAAVMVIGHSRLGKTALWAGAIDDRFAIVISNDSGCGGAALSRRRVGETVAVINERFPHWFCDGFSVYDDREAEMPMDQDRLIALAAPRPIAVGSASQDEWADPEGEFLSALAASSVYQSLGHIGLASSNDDAEDNQAALVSFPPPGGALQGGRISYHLREGVHDLTVEDWRRYLDFADRHVAASAD